MLSRKTGNVYSNLENDVLLKRISKFQRLRPPPPGGGGHMEVILRRLDVGADSRFNDASTALYTCHIDTRGLLSTRL